MTDVQVHRVRFHRNGVAGAPFYAVEATLHNDGRPVRVVVSVFTDVHEDEIVPLKIDGLNPVVSVVDIDNPGECWRGDLILEDVWPGIVAADESQEAYR